MKNHLLGLVLLLVSASPGLSVFCQSTPEAKTVDTAKDKYAAESIVLVKTLVAYQMAADGTGTHIHTVVARIQSEAAVKELGVIGVSYAGATERVEFQYARVRRADGTVVETPVTDALDVPMEVTRQAPFYSDLKQKQLPIRSLRVGDTLEWQAKVVRTQSEAPGQFWGQETFPEDAVALEESVELRAPKDKIVKVWSPTLKAAETVEGNERVWRWTTSQLKSTAMLKEEAEAKKKVPWTAAQELDAKEGKLPSIAWTTFPSWEAVGAWYRGLEDDRMAPSEKVKAKVAEVTTGKTTEEERVRAVYAYVATQVRYIGVAFGIGRYQPHKADEVLENQYGDCKDKHTLLAAMLGALGVKADAVLIGAGIRFNPDVPSPAAFNHLITLATVDGKPVWLDTTAEVAPYQMLLYVIRDHKALVVPEAGVARLEQTPLELPFKSFVKMTAAGTLDKDGISESKMTLAVRGDEEVELRAVLRQVPPARYDELMQNLSRGMGYAGTTSHAEFGRAEDTAEPLAIHYDYHREKAGNDWEHLRTIAQLYPVSLPAVDEKDPPMQAIQLGVLRTETSNAEMKLPEGWGAEVPEAIHAHSAYANLDETFRFEKGTLYAERKLEVLKESVPQADWKSYKKWADEADLGKEEYVQLTRPGTKESAMNIVGGLGAAPDLNGMLKSGEAAGLVKDAYEAVQNGNFKTAKSKLDEAKEINEHQPRLWSTYGFLAFRKGEMTEALGDYEKELGFHPDSVNVYRDVVTAYIAMGKDADAIATMRRWVVAEPSNPEPTTALTQALINDEEYADAVKAVEGGIAGLPAEAGKDESLQMLLGTAQMKAGMKEKGTATLTPLLQSDNSVILNGAAYELADAGVDLDLAEAGARSSLKKQEEQSRTWTLDESYGTLRMKSRALIATWDTMGLVLYRQGKMAEAEEYLHASWMSHQDADVGEHLGDLLLKKGDRANAINMYMLALSTIFPYDPMGKRRVKQMPVETRLHKKLAAVGGAAAEASFSIEKGDLALQALRKVQLGPANSLSGTAEYKILLSPNGVERVEPLGASEISGGTERLKKASLKGYWPTGSDSRLVRLGFLNCHATTCELIFEP